MYDDSKRLADMELQHAVEHNRAEVYDLLATVYHDDVNDGISIPVPDLAKFIHELVNCAMDTDETGEAMELLRIAFYDMQFDFSGVECSITFPTFRI